MFKFISTFLIFWFFVGLIFLSFFYNPSFYKNFILKTIQKYVPSYHIEVKGFDFSLNPNLIFFVEKLHIQDKEKHTSYKFSKISFTFSTPDLLLNKFKLKKISILGGESEIFIQRDNKQEEFWKDKKTLDFLSFIQQIENIKIENYFFSIIDKNKKENFYINTLSLKFPHTLKNYYKKINIQLNGQWNEADIETSLNVSIDKDEIERKFYSLGFNQKTYSFLYQKSNFEIQSKIKNLSLAPFSIFLKNYLPYLNLSESSLFIHRLKLNKQKNKQLLAKAQLELKNYILSNKKNNLTLSFNSNYSLSRNQMSIKNFHLKAEKKIILSGSGNYFFNQSSHFNISSNTIDYDSFMNFIQGFYIEYDDNDKNSDYPITASVKVKKIFFDNLLFENIDMDMNYENSLLEFKNIKSDFYEGILYSSFYVDFKEKENSIKGSVSYKEVNVQKLISVFSDRNFVVGNMQANFTFSSIFEDGDDLLKNLKLQGNSVINDFNLEEDLDFRILIALRLGSLINFTQYIEEDNILNTSYFINQEKFFFRSIQILNTSMDLLGSGYIEFNGNTNINLSVEYGGTFIGNILKVPVEYTGNLQEELKVKVNFIKPVLRFTFSFYGSLFFLGYTSYIYRRNISPIALFFAGLGGGVLSASVYDYFSGIWKNFYSKKTEEDKEEH